MIYSLMEKKSSTKCRMFPYLGSLEKVNGVQPYQAFKK